MHTYAKQDGNFLKNFFIIYFRFLEIRLNLLYFFQGENDLNKQLYDRLTARKIIYLVKASLHGQLILRFAVCSRLTEEKDVHLAWREIQSATEEVLEKNNIIEESDLLDVNHNIAGKRENKMEAGNVNVDVEMKVMEKCQIDMESGCVGVETVTLGKAVAVK